MNQDFLKSISDKLTVLIRLQASQKKIDSMTISDALELVDGMNLTDIEVAKMFGFSAQALRNARSKNKKIK